MPTFLGEGKKQMTSWKDEWALGKQRGGSVCGHVCLGGCCLSFSEKSLIRFAVRRGFMTVEFWEGSSSFRQIRDFRTPLPSPQNNSYVKEAFLRVISLSTSNLTQWLCSVY